MKALYEKVWELVASGQLTQIKLLRKAEAKVSDIEKIEKTLSAYEEWSVSDKCIFHNGEPISPILAAWKGCIAVQSEDRLSRFHILCVYFGDSRYDFAIPGDMSEVKKLPDLQLSGAEVESLVKIANTISGQKKAKTVTIKDAHPARDTVCRNTTVSDRALSKDEQARLFKLLTSSILLNFIALAAIDIQLRSVKLLRSCPHLLYSIYAKAEDRAEFEESNEWSPILSALTVSNERGPYGFAPIWLHPDSKGGWRNFQVILGRLFFVMYREKANLAPILDDYGTAVQNAQTGDSDAVPKYPPALLCGPSILPHPFVVLFQDEMDTPKGLKKNDYSILRVAISRVVNVETAKGLRNVWRAKMQDPSNELGSGRVLWLASLAEVVSAEWFDDVSMRNSYREFCSNSVKRQEAKLANTESILRELFYRLTHLYENGPSVFNAEGADKKAVKDALDDAASHIAFSKTLKKGDDASRPLLCFTIQSFRRFLQETGTNLVLRSAFIDRCREYGVYCERKNVPLNGGTIDVEAFYIEELEKYRSEDSK